MQKNGKLVFLIFKIFNFADIYKNYLNYVRLDKKYWNSRYKIQETGWDVGKITTPLKKYFDQLEDKKLKILIPGSGNSYEAEYLHYLKFKNVYVLDFSNIALKNLKKRAPSFPDNHLLNVNFFHLNNKFDLIIEQTFFCAISVRNRSRYVKKASQLLKKNGKLVGLLFNDTLNQDKPPFGAHRQDYIKYFSSNFKIKVLDNCYNSIEERKGRELFINLIKLNNK